MFLIRFDSSYRYKGGAAHREGSMIRFVQILKRNRPEAKDIQAKDWLNTRFMAELEKEGFLAKVFGGSG
jgi:hypothetical protein